MNRSRDWGFTPAAERTVQLCRRVSQAAGVQKDWSAVLLLSLLSDESLAAACLRDCGIVAGDLGELLPAGVSADSVLLFSDQIESEGSGCGVVHSLTEVSDPDDFRRLLECAREVARRETVDGAITSAVLLLAVFEHWSKLRVILGLRGITEVQLRQLLFPREEVERLLLEPGELLWGCGSGAAGAVAAGAVAAGAVAAGVNIDRGLLRVLDAGLNRAREGLRVLEDYGRFVRDDGAVATELKQLRHELCEAEGRVLALRPGSDARLQSRDTVGDVGADVTLASELQRVDSGSLIVANLRRVQESLRSLEEFGKLLDVEFAGRMKRLRYRSYTLEQQLCSATNLQLSTAGVQRRERLRKATLYVLISESQCRRSWQDTVRMILEGGADIVQLREKALGDAELLRRATWVRRECESAGALFVMNDRPDLAVLSAADGVHVGQEELSAEACRRIVTSESLTGLSTHDISQFHSARLSGADYAGVGPVFPSTTKQFDEFPGLAYVTAAAAADGVFPWFAIGGITEVNLNEVLQAGAERIAVGGAVTAAVDPGIAAARLQSILRAG